MWRHWHWSSSRVELICYSADKAKFADFEQSQTDLLQLVLSGGLPLAAAR